MKNTIYILIILGMCLIVSCNSFPKTKFNDVDVKVLEKLVKIKIPESPLNVTLKNCLLNKIEYYKNNPDSIDPANLFEPLSYDKIDSISIPRIFYNVDSSIIFFYVILRNSNDSKISYDGFSLMGFRNNTPQYEIYPITQYSAVSMYTYDEAYEVLIACYQFKLKDQGDTDGRKFNNNVGEDDFWANSLYLTKCSNGLYYFQTYRYTIYTGDTVHYEPYNYPTCN